MDWWGAPSRASWIPTLHGGCKLYHGVPCSMVVPFSMALLTTSSWLYHGVVAVHILVDTHDLESIGDNVLG